MRVSSLQKIRSCWCVSWKRIVTGHYEQYYHFTIWARKYEEKNPRYNFIKHIHNSPKKFEIQDMKTGEIIIYSSVYKAAKRFNQQSRLISTDDGKVLRNRYAIKV